MGGSIVYVVYPDVVIPAGRSYVAKDVGNYLRILECSTASKLRVKFDDLGEQDIENGIGLNFDGEFSRVAIINPLALPITLSFAIAKGKIDDSRFSFTGTLLTNSTPNALSTPALVNVTDAAGGDEVVAAAGATRSVVLRNVGLNPCWLGDANIDPATDRGRKLDPGDEVEWLTAAQIKGRCAAGLTTTISPTINSKV